MKRSKVIEDGLTVRSLRLAQELVQDGLFEPGRHGLKLNEGVSLAEIVSAVGAGLRSGSSEEGCVNVRLMGVELSRRLGVAQ